MRKVILTVIVAASVMSCSKKVENKDIVITEVINMEHRPLNFESSKRENNAHQGQYYSSVDSVAQFGIGYEYVLNDSLKNRNLTVYVSCWMRETQFPIEGGMTVGLSNAEGIKQWHSFTIKNKDYKLGEWEKISDSISYPKELLKDQLIKIGVVALKKDGSDLLDIDDLQIKYKFSK